MAEITAAIDEAGANDLLDGALASMGTLSDSGTRRLGPVDVDYTINGKLVSGNVDLIAPGTIRIQNLHVDWSAALLLSLDLSDIVPNFCLPQVCLTIPFIGRVCTPKICIDWPSVSVPVALADFAEATADLGLVVTLNGASWDVDAVVQSVSQLRFGLSTAAMLAIVEAAAVPVLLAIPFIGLVLAVILRGLILALQVAGLDGLLGALLTPFFTGLTVRLYSQARRFLLLPADGPFDPDVFINLDAVTAGVRYTTEDELVLAFDVSP